MINLNSIKFRFKILKFKNFQIKNIGTKIQNETMHAKIIDSGFKQPKNIDDNDKKMMEQFGAKYTIFKS